MKKNIFYWAILVSGLTLGGYTSDAYAGPALDVVQSEQGNLFQLLKKSNEPSKVQEVFDKMLDYGALAEASLGSEWASRTDAERKEFSDLLKQLVRKAYERNLRKTLNFDIAYLGEEAASDGSTRVKTKATSSNAREEPVEINFKMLERSGNWKVQDIETEGVSLVSSYRSQFTKIIKKDGFVVLIKKMKDKLAKGEVE